MIQRSAGRLLGGKQTSCYPRSVAEPPESLKGQSPAVPHQRPPEHPRRTPFIPAAFARLLCAAPFALALGAALPAQATPADRAELRRAIDALFAQAPLSSARVSAQIVSLDDGQVLYARDADAQLNPASNTKLVTSAAALLRLGPEFRFTTDVLTDRPIVRGRAGILYVKGRGDPSITTERLQGLVADLWHRGLREASGLVLDDTYFDREAWGPGWEQESSDKAYAAPVGPLSLNHNSVAIYIAPGEGKNARARVDLEPQAPGYFVVENGVSTVRQGGRRRVIAHTFADGERARVAVSGRIAAKADALVLYRRVSDPTFYFGHALKQLLQERGIRVSGRVRRGQAPESAVLVNSYDSPELAEIVRDMNKISSNFIAEMLVKTLGAELRGVPGTWAKGLAVTQDLLAELGIQRGTYQLRNGSGLNDTNRFSAQQMTGLLVAVWKRFPVASEFVSSLGIAARDGTMRLRMEGTDAAGRLRAKTGTLDKVTALSGYVQALGGERFVFSLLVNDWSGRTTPVISSVDRFGGLLAALGGPELVAREAALVALSGQQPPEASPAELKARIATYAALSQSTDKKNLPFLRTALRTERDPLVRAVVADALYRSDPDLGGGALLEATQASPDVFVRLRALGRELALPLPLVPSLLDLAAEGSSEALARVLAVAPLARGPQRDEALERALSEGLVDVGEAAPEETLTALRAAPAPQARAAVELIAFGLLQAGVDSQKFPLARVLRVRAAAADSPQAQEWLSLLEHHAQPAPEALAAVTSPPPSAAPGSAEKAAPTSPPAPAAASAATPSPAAASQRSSANVPAPLPSQDSPPGAAPSSATTPEPDPAPSSPPAEKVLEPAASSSRRRVRKPAAAAPATLPVATSSLAPEVPASGVGATRPAAGAGTEKPAASPARGVVAAAAAGAVDSAAAATAQSNAGPPPSGTARRSRRTRGKPREGTKGCDTSSGSCTGTAAAPPAVPAVSPAQHAAESTAAEP
jgi:serine-type D-Ala-D-Ala carboxypeptidase/endopeptidase (penicillin-binding protein 4)